jgi:hypothetical protein
MSDSNGIDSHMGESEQATKPFAGGQDTLMETPEKGKGKAAEQIPVADDDEDDDDEEEVSSPMCYARAA